MVQTLVIDNGHIVISAGSAITLAQLQFLYTLPPVEIKPEKLGRGVRVSKENDLRFGS